MRGKNLIFADLELSSFNDKPSHNISTPDNCFARRHRCNGYVNNVVYLRWIQDLAEAHWNHSASEELRSKYAWVVLRHEIDYSSPAVLNDEMIGTTWVELPDGARSTRHVEIFNQTKNKLSAKAKTTWCLLSASTMRPKRVESNITDIFC